MTRTAVLGIYALGLVLVAVALFLAFTEPALALQARRGARAGGPELAMVAGALGTLGLSAIGGGLYLRRRKDG